MKNWIDNIYIEWTINQLLNDKKHSDDSNKLVFNAIKCSKYLFIVNNDHNYHHKLWLISKIKSKKFKPPCDERHWHLQPFSVLFGDDVQFSTCAPNRSTFLWTPFDTPNHCKPLWVREMSPFGVWSGMMTTHHERKTMRVK